MENNETTKMETLKKELAQRGLDIPPYYQQPYTKDQEIVDLLKGVDAKSGPGTVLVYAELNLKFSNFTKNPASQIINNAGLGIMLASTGLNPQFNKKSPPAHIVPPESILELRGIISLLEEVKAPSGRGSVLAYAQDRLEHAMRWKEIIDGINEDKKDMRTLLEREGIIKREPATGREKTGIQLKIGKDGATGKLDGTAFGIDLSANSIAVDAGRLEVKPAAEASMDKTAIKIPVCWTILRSP
jgi:hypothetical protein